MDNKELTAKQKELMDEFNRSVEAEPDIKKWIDQRKKINLIVFIYVIAYCIMEFLAYNSVNADTSIIKTVIKAIVACFWFGLFLLPHAPWKASFMIYATALYNILGFAALFKSDRDIGMYFQNGPILCIYFVMSFLVPVLLLLLAFWLTLPKKHREYSDRAYELNQAYVNKAKELTTKK